MFPIVEAGPSLETASLPAFVVARDGLYLRKRSLLGLSQTKVGRVAHLPDGKEFVDYALPKVPSDLMARAVGFFRAVYRLHKTEAAALLLWRDGELTVVAAPGDPLPGGSSIYTLVWLGAYNQDGTYTPYFEVPDINDEGDVAFLAYLSGGTYGGLFVWRQGTIEIMALMADYFTVGFMMNAADQHLPADRQPLLPVPARRR